MNTTQKPLLKVGIFSDIQALPSRNDWGMYNFTKALQIYKEKEIDLLVNAGDLAEGGDPETYALYWQLIAEAFPGNMPEHIACEGNHDCNGKAPFKENFAKVCTCLRRECVNPEHRVIGGYDFITFATFDRIHYAEEELPALEKACLLYTSREVTQVNELLYQMENFNGVMIGATNFAKNLDPAVMRRFTFKLDFNYLDNAGKKIFFERMFQTELNEAELAQLNAIPNLAPGDFRTVRQALYYLENDSNALRLESLAKESAAKPGTSGSSRSKFGF